MLEVKWVCDKCKHENRGRSKPIFEKGGTFNVDEICNFDVDVFKLACKKCKKEAEFEIVITDLQGIEL